MITPWNFPLLMPAMDVIPALLTGAAVILKPSEVTPLSALELARGWREIGAPPVLACVTGRGGTGAAVVDVVDMVQFTGSTVRVANDSVYGLSATVWTGSRSRGDAIARRLEAGAVNVNDMFSNLFCFGLPHGGWKSSGIGARFGGASGLHKYCRVQAVTAPRFPTLTNEPLWYPYTPSLGRVAARLLRAIVARDVRRRFFGNRR